jgi:hypothetical protein
VSRGGLIIVSCLMASFICMAQEKTAISPPSVVDDVKPVPVLSAGVAFLRRHCRKQCALEHLAGR